jgi:hypothetical protein
MRWPAELRSAPRLPAAVLRTRDRAAAADCQKARAHEGTKIDVKRESKKICRLMFIGHTWGSVELLGVLIWSFET